MKGRLPRFVPEMSGAPGVEVLNLGVPAYTTAQELDQLLEKGLPLEPDIVILGFVLNDALPGGDRRPKIDLPFKNLLRRSALYRFIGRLYQHGALVAMAEVVPGDRKVADILEYERANTETLESGRPEVEGARREAVDDIRAMAEACALRGVPFLVVIWPNRYQIEEPDYARARFNERLADDLTAAGIPSIDLFPVFVTEAAGRSLYLPDTHPSASGHAIAARVVAHWIGERARTAEDES